VSRPEITGRKTSSAPVELGAYTIETFCEAHGISTAMYFKLKAQGLGPDEMEVGRRRPISREAAARWREQREAAAKESNQAKQEASEIV
jgi:hypothetical protein